MQKSIMRLLRSQNKIVDIMSAGSPINCKSLFHKSGMSIDWFVYVMQELLASGRVEKSGETGYRLNQ